MFVGEAIKTVNLKADLPSVHEAVERLGREVTLAQQQKEAFLKIVHGYGSSGVGGDIRIAVQKRLRGMVDAGDIRACFFGEEWSKSSDAVWRLLQERAELKKDADLGRGNRGITVVLL